MNWLLRALLKPTYEVRVASLKSGRNLMGQKHYQGKDYGKALEAFRSQVEKAKPDHLVTLRAIRDVKSSIKVSNEPGTATFINTGDYKADEAKPIFSEPEKQEEVRQQEHVCNTNGPLVPDPRGGGYTVSCSACGAAQTQLPGE